MQVFQQRGWIPVLALFAFSTVMQASIFAVVPTVTQVGSLYQYNYSIANNSGEDLPVLDIVVTPGAATIQNLTAAPGFEDAYDPILGLVSFLENTNTFGPAAISGFIFDSPIAPGATTFEATLLDANFNVSTAEGPTIGPRVTATPEPGYLPLLAFCVPLCIFLNKRSKQSIKSVNRHREDYK